jgi:hypothetical protein
MKFGLYTLLIESHLRRLPGFNFGWGNGYVLLPYNHPFYGVHYDDIGVDIHGGLTFSDYFDIKRFPVWIADREIGGDITMETYKKFDRYWIIGFDTAHCDDGLDTCPKTYVMSETNKLLEQCLDDGITEIQKYKSVYLRKDKLKKINNKMPL